MTSPYKRRDTVSWALYDWANSAFATTVRVVDGVHGHAADGRATTLPAHAAGLAPVDVGLLGVANLAHTRTRAEINVADFTRWHTQLCEWAVLSYQLNAGTS